MDLERFFYDHLYALQELLRIPSVYDAATVTKDRPYGKGVAAALEYMRQLAFRDGFQVLEYDGHAIGIRICEGKQDERVDIASHLDVVEPGSGWSVDPFGALIRDGKLYGRGSQDMKTSAFLTYLALKMLWEEGVPFKRELRIVLGCDEERTMDDMAYYLKKAGKPAFAFTPDGRFPMAIGEKGALMWRLKGQYAGIVEEMDCGVQCNVISPEAEAVLKPRSAVGEDIFCPDELMNLLCQTCEKAGIEGTVKREGETIIVKVRGKAAHASMPEDGHSATVDLFYLLSKIDPVMENLYQCFRDPYGSRLGAITADGEQTQFTVNLGVFRIKNGQCYGEVDARYPFGMTSSDLTEKLAQECALQVSLDYDSPPIMNDVDDVFVACLLETYREMTGDLNAPIVSGGVSYSKIFGHCVGYGPVGPWMENLVHRADEYIGLEDCIRAFSIYHEAMKKLAML